MAIKFGLFDPIILPVASTKLATSQQIGGSHFSETYEDEDNEGWTLVTRHRAKKNHPKCVKMLETQKKAHQLISKPKQTLVQRKKTPSEFHKAIQQHVKRPITLSEFMPSQLKEVKCHSPRKPEDGEAKPHILEKSDQKKKESSQPVKRVDEITKNLGNLTLPLTSLQKDEVTKPSLKGFVRPSKGPLVEHDELPSQRADCFDPNAYRLLVKAGYDHEDVTKIGKPSDRQSVFDRLSRPSALNTKRVVRFAKPRKPSFKRSARREKRRSSLTSESNEFHSKFPSRMERRNELVVTTGETLRAKAHTVVVTKPISILKDEEIFDDELILTSNHISVIEDDEKPHEEGAQEAPSSFEEGNQSTIDEIKEINLGTEEEPRQPS
ncbi:hypothetical protein COLO4_25539 [Corchorus olitorius]|uniref:Uncharacterized protein n=1 Tax=Corchorus olitorius TaxID=93759 RepID=A0A1R3I1Z7_9ROSI|nr:hypothetical protein COLO4_25539 [Corchorus olitorius]